MCVCVCVVDKNIVTALWADGVRGPQALTDLLLRHEHHVGLDGGGRDVQLRGQVRVLLSAPVR